MSIYAIQQYHRELDKIIHYGGSKKETAIRLQRKELAAKDHPKAKLKALKDIGVIG